MVHKKAGQKDTESLGKQAGPWEVRDQQTCLESGEYLVVTIFLTFVFVVGQQWGGLQASDGWRGP